MEIIISIIIIVSIFLLDYITQKYTDYAINEAIDNLNEIKESIKKENINNEDVLKNMEKKYKRWLEHHKRLAFYIEHNELEKVETNFIAGKSFIETAKYEDATSEIEKTIFVLQHINDKYSVNLENIF